MPSILAFELFVLDLPFKKPFKHAAADRNSSHSIMLKCITDSGHKGYGESLPRDYVTGETREASVRHLRENILPKLLGRTFDSFADLLKFLQSCDGKAPADWLDPAVPQTAAWAAVDLALLDAFGNAFDHPVRLNDQEPDGNFRYSGVCSSDRGLKALKTLLLLRLYGIRAIKLKVENTTAEALAAARLCRVVMGGGCDIRVDANMAWDQETAIDAMQSLSRYGIRSFEQPLAAEDTNGMARLIRETGLEVMADESFNDRLSLQQLIAVGGCSSINVRIAKCGGLIAAYNRCQEALAAGLKIQVGCQVGETSLLSSAQLLLIAAVGKVTYGEGCFGLHLLREDPVQPLKQFGYGGRPPAFPQGSGLGIEVNEEILNRYCSERIRIEN